MSVSRTLGSYAHGNMLSLTFIFYNNSIPLQDYLRTKTQSESLTPLIFNHVICFNTKPYLNFNSYHVKEHSLNKGFISATILDFLGYLHNVERMAQIFCSQCFTFQSLQFFRLISQSVLTVLFYLKTFQLLNAAHWRCQ